MVFMQFDFSGDYACFYIVLKKMIVISM